MEPIIIKKAGLQTLSFEDTQYIHTLIKDIEEMTKSFSQNEVEISTENEVKNFSKNKNETETRKENIESAEQQRIKRLEERINQLNSDKPEYLEELLALESKKLQLLENQKTHLAVEPPSKPKTHLGVSPPSGSPSGEKKMIDATETSSQTKEKQPPKKQQPLFSNEQLQNATQIRNQLHQYLFANSPTEWYQKPTEKRNIVDSYINQTAKILSGKTATELDTNDIQTARLFAFNNAPKEILEHPAVLAIERFYNYQNSQGHSGVNPEKIKNIDSIQDNKLAPSIIKQISETEKTENKNNTATK